MAGKTTLMIRILADATQAAATMRTASGSAGKLASGFQKAALPAVAIVAGLGAMGKSAAEDAQGQAILAQQLRKSAGATDAHVASVEDWISTTSLATGVADDQLRPAFASLARATGDVSQAQSGMGAALDVAAATGKDTQTVADALAKAYAGNTGALSKLVPGMDKAVLKSGDMNAILGELAKKTGGAAAAAADTAAGKWQRSQVAFSETKEAIGAGLLPMLDKLTGYLATFGQWASKNTTLVTAFALTLGVLAGAVLAVNAAMKVAAAATKVWTAMQWLLNAAMSMNPIGLIILGILALVAVFVIAYRKSETFRKIVQGAWKGIQTAAKAAWDFIWKYVIQPYLRYVAMMWKAVQIAAALIATAWGKIKNAFKGAWDWIWDTFIGPWIDGFKAIVDAIKGVIEWIKKIKIPKPVQWLIDKGKDVFKGAPAVPPAPVPARGRRGAPGGATSSVGSTGSSYAGLFDGATFVLEIDGRAVEGAVRRVTVAQDRALARRILNGRPVGVT